MNELTELPTLRHNRGLIADPASFARGANAASGLYLCGEAFAATDGASLRGRPLRWPVCKLHLAAH